MNIYINGEPRDIPVQTTAAILIDMLELGGKRLAMEVNEEIVPRSSFDQYCLQDGDKVEIVHAIGGG